MTDDPQRTGYMTKADAAAMLGLSERRTSEVKGIAHKKLYDPLTKRNALFFRRSDVERVLTERTPLAAVMPANASSLVLQGAAAALIRKEKETDQADASASIVRSRDWLRVSELAALWDVSEGAILELIRCGELPARRFACRDPWRVHRTDAEALRGERQAVGQSAS